MKMSLEIQKKCRSLVLSDNLLREVMHRLDSAISAGLKKLTHPQAEVKCFPTYVQELPHGNEEGKYLALDLGGTNFRVLMIFCTLEGCRMEFETYPLSKDLMIGNGDDLFDYIALCLDDFVHKKGVQNENLDLGFTFSFPVLQSSLTQGLLMHWTKGFQCKGVVGNNIVELLMAAVNRRKDLRISVVALLNDTTGCLVSCAYKHKHCKVGVILGTGFNACYLEKCQNVETFNNERGKPFIIINTEWGALGSDGTLDFIRTEYDRTVDQRSLNPGLQIFEKMVSGMYMGELVRLIMEKCTKEGILFKGQGSDKLFTPGSFTTSDISSIESTEKGNLGVCCALLKEGLDLPYSTAQDCLDVHYICTQVSSRSANLASAAIAVLINRTDFKTVTVGVDGSVYRYHPHFHARMSRKIPTLLTTPRTLTLVLSQDGSGRGAAFVSAVAAAEKREHENKVKQEEREDAIRQVRMQREQDMWNGQHPMLGQKDDKIWVSHQSGETVESQKLSQQQYTQNLQQYVQNEQPSVQNQEQTVQNQKQTVKHQHIYQNEEEDYVKQEKEEEEEENCDCSDIQMNVCDCCNHCSY